MDKLSDYQSYLNSFISMTRNIFTLSSLSLAMIGFSDRFNKYQKIVKILGMTILLFSIIYGFYTTNLFGRYIEDIKSENKNLSKIQINEWKKFKILNYIFIFILTVVFLIILFRKIIP